MYNYHTLYNMYNLILLTHVQPGYITVLSKYVHFQELHRYLGILWDLTVPSKGLGPFLQHLATSFARFKSQGCSWVQRMATSLVYLWSDSISSGADVCRGCCEKWFCVFCSCPFWQLVETEKITQQEDSKAEKASEKKSDWVERDGAQCFRNPGLQRWMLSFDVSCI